MKVKELSNIPQRMGDAILRLRDNGGLPVRNDKEILFPRDPQAKFYEIAKGQQFLCTCAEQDRWNSQRQTRRLFFGGMDENPFLVELKMECLEALLEGEEAFFEGLKPQHVKDYERKYGWKATRQGDFFALPFELKGRLDWQTFLRQYMPEGHKKELVMKLADQHSVFDTRHTITGVTTVVGGLLFADGVIQAPDHEDLFLPGVHLIEQAVGLVDPPDAD